ncbi:MAG: hypothetical protein HY059_18050 [Proteobacteria bacterium]|nr:hypothetical protein [Pseudomonadota bacterium]
MNTLNWKPAHKLAGVAVCVIGGVVGTLAAWLQSPFYRVCQTSFLSRQPECRRALYGWIPKLSLYWPWSLTGIAIFGFVFYAVMQRRLQK